ncbi:MAG TPA: TlpA disulfide reductase family protein [Roseiflexaceae bacterium]|nr:TlpA disulfide reductase family protein [Roseiflexaceae bacterium]HMP42465.1 TlpA disulfide reductase family protein [Roseiflexaceae bacterium]
MQHPTHWNHLLVITLLAGLGWIVMTRVPPEQPAVLGEVRMPPAAEAAPRENHPAPDFTLEDLNGTPVSLSALRGQVVLINVWATWCPPCRAEMPIIQAAYERYHDQGFTVLAVNLREDTATVAQYMQQNGLTFPALLDRDGHVSMVYLARAVPSSFFIDRNGTVRAVYRGAMARSVVSGTVEQLLAEAP